MPNSFPLEQRSVEVLALGNADSGIESRPPISKPNSPFPAARSRENRPASAEAEATFDRDELFEQFRAAAGPA